MNLVHVRRNHHLVVAALDRPDDVSHRVGLQSVDLRLQFAADDLPHAVLVARNATGLGDLLQEFEIVRERLSVAYARNALAPGFGGATETPGPVYPDHDHVR